ncbi:MAG: hypothetical protein COW19_01355 [Zetaproteobacteria bacterium CG12_big_fil_rev_8_21_14_0_65_55_1124]|nr:MAG: hypothetical protein AUJ58_08945 [Zetaproteobacteria bacterium CG1_02_55_237]PIS20515.1 MAG: hypothetical protein COT53_00400 [Zetaproteobacteria bacterium CG08_land_8_20_14_0_20_55_17]PIW43792.1 MAG: hypothetical protein COW19_01355 [Zetaproteobacteria bacterium CG12_big_fil_rev_8_21_14_0_65_55_1124]PIY53329.1 MAG: hypothetical protein COZ01_04555 [Zetaproteobacteria bacterium CG_4_10_14_0_8_um_filter_55_43]PIZ40099.1 MAG: hypothetical protein COY36_00420 [Zetaproteobacteria bacterium 
MTKFVSIIILTEVPLSRRDYERFGIEILSRHFFVRVLDCTAWINPSFWGENATIGYECPERLKITAWDELEGQLTRLSGQYIVIDYLGDCSTALYVRQYLKKKRVLRVLVRCGLIPEPNSLERIRRASRQGSFVMRGIRKVLRDGLSLIRPKLPQADMAVVAGEAALRDRRVQKAEHIWVHSFDFDVYLRCRGKGKETDVPYAVFLDSDLAFHADFELGGENPMVTAERYYPAINHFFDRFELLTGLKVVIAAHPRSRYDLRPDLYGHRIPVLHKTCELVKDASLVMTTQSTAISLAVMCNKPILYLNTDEHENCDYIGYMYEAASALKSNIINIDHFSDAELNLVDLMEVSDDAYRYYMNTYIKHPGTPDAPIWEIFSAYIQRKFCVPSD